MPATSRSETAQPGAARIVRRYVAMGDSFTAGADGLEGGCFADELARRLRDVNPALDYRNLAVAGARSDAVAGQQLGPALALRPDLVTLVCGANDVLLSVRPDVERYAATLQAMLRDLRARLPRAAILTATTPNFAGFVGLHDRSRKRVEGSLLRLAEVTRIVARHNGVACLEFAAHPAAGERESFAGDGYHPSPEGNRRAAVAFSSALRSHFGIAAPDIRSEEAA